MEDITKAIDFTIITGFLGAGKSTLLQYLLTNKHRKNLAIIVNEFGEIGIDGALILDESGGRMLEVNNGCVCCEVREDLVVAITKLLDNQSKGLINFDHIVMETTGVARPGPIVETLHTPSLKPLVSLNGIITVVDAYYITSQLNKFSEVQEQIGVADYIILNKIDLVDTKQLQQIHKRINTMNAQAQLQTANKCRVDILPLFDIVNNSMSRLNAGFTNAPVAQKTMNSPLIHSHKHDSHLDNISSISIEVMEPLHKELLLDWFSFFIMRYEERLLRFKGILNFKGHDKRTIFQGIHSLFEAKPDRKWLDGEQPITRIVFIGRNLPENKIRQGIKDCISN